MLRALILAFAVACGFWTTAAWPQADSSNPNAEDAVRAANQINPAIQSIGDIFAIHCSDNALNGVPGFGYDSSTHDCPHVKAYKSIFEPQDTLKTARAKIAQRLKNLGLKSEIENSFRSGDPYDLVRLERLASIVIPALEKYPPTFFRKIGFKKVVLAKDLVVSGSARKAMPDPSADKMYYADNNDVVCEAGMENRVHHELYHFIEAKLNGSMYYKDPNWMKMNSNGFRYGSGGAAAYNLGQNWQNLGHPAPGMISRYAAFAPEEDKAELFGWLMTEGYAARLKQWAAQDPILDAKRRYLIHFLDRASDGTMNASFFDGISNPPEPTKRRSEARP